MSFWPEQRIDQPEPEPDCAREDKAQAVFDRHMLAALSGRGDFWPLSPGHRQEGHAAEWDCEQELMILAALQEALQHEEWSPQRKWAWVVIAIEGEAEKMANYYERRV